MVAMCTGASIVFCSSDESPPTLFHSSTNTFFKVSLVGIQFTYNRPSETFFFFPGALKCWCGTMFSQAPTRDSQDLFAVFSFVLYLLDGDDNCMLSVQSSTTDLHYTCWQSGENCQVVSAGAFTLLCHAFFFFLLSCPRVVCSMIPSCRPDTASFRSCLLLSPGFFNTQEAGV